MFTDRPTDATDRTHTFWSPAYPLQPGFPEQPAYGILRDHGQATVSLVLGAIALCTGLLIVSPVAWWLGSQALAEIDASPGVYHNRGMAEAGQICGLIGTALLALGSLVLAGLAVLLSAAS
ncbi:DUF4190 domain-containing protein [Kribbella turkmenica]|uniref:DUF4190 domain-containing protein n=1 Tax=Kribbella turkmenica TaxID=2530375 RepID=A0A4R4WUS4_9ACTN|nr:DUF4190 domain-containing protein [Kribbella turkmenica]TDD21385.1 DUF4190 domain-containing protein [Kribbella turkmenica]